MTAPDRAGAGRAVLAATFCGVMAGGAAVGAPPGRAGLTAAAVLRAAYGAALCCAPGAMLRLEGGAGASCAPHARAVARVLGGRHLAQAFLAAARPTPAVLALGAGTDLLHSASMATLGVLDGPRRRLGLTDGLIAAAFAAGGWTLARHSQAVRCQRPGRG